MTEEAPDRDVIWRAWPLSGNGVPGPHLRMKGYRRELSYLHAFREEPSEAQDTVKTLCHQVPGGETRKPSFRESSYKGKCETCESIAAYGSARWERKRDVEENPVDGVRYELGDRKTGYWFRFPKNVEVKREIRRRIPGDGHRVWGSWLKGVWVSHAYVDVICEILEEHFDWDAPESLEPEGRPDYSQSLKDIR